MTYEIAFFDRLQCPRDKKKESIKLMETLVVLAEKSRKMGLLVLEDDLANLKDTFLKKGLQMVIDGTDPVVVRDVLRTRMLSSGLKGANLLNNVLILEGVVAIQAGDNPRIVADKLSCFLGKDIDLWDKHWLKLRKKLGDTDSFPVADAPCPDAATDMQSSTGTVNAIIGSLSFEKIAELHDVSIQKILREVDSQCLGLALKGCTSAVASKIYGNMSERAAMLLKEDVDYMGPVQKESVIQAQEVILNIALKLADAGDIVFPDGSEMIG
ncbi:MAG: hypothetical protein KBA61_00855 [Spirochaetes bacterium]|nr:hypothetical protein [Spirochaetota bacterium]